MKIVVARAGAPEREVSAEIIKYDGNKKQPRWMDLQPGTSSHLTISSGQLFTS